MKKGKKSKLFEGLVFFAKMCYSLDKKYIYHLMMQQLYQAAIAISVVMFPQYIIDCTFGDHDMQKALCIAGAFCMCLLVLYLLSAYTKKKVTEHRTILYKEVELSISNMMMHTEFEKIENEKFLNTKARAEKYLFGDGRGFGYVLENAFQLLSDAITLLFLSGVIITLNPIILILLVVILVLNTRINMIIQQKIIEITREKAQHERLSNYYSQVSQDFRYGKDIRGYQASGWLLERYRKQLTDMQSFYDKIAFHSLKYEAAVAITSIIQQMVSYGYVIFCGVKKWISVGQFSMYLSSIATFSSTLKNMTGNLVSMHQYTEYYQDYIEYMNYQNQKQEVSEKGCTFTNQIEFKNVSFQYQGQEKEALKNINLVIHPGDKILLVGENGAGKSTLIKLLLRIYQPTQGAIYLNGRNIQEFEEAEYARLFSTVFQDYRLFACSLEENISMSSQSDPQKIHKVLDIVGLNDKVNLLKKGIHTNIYKEFAADGYVPSGGEGQKIAICRALYKNADIIVMDEPNAALDPVSESDLYQVFEASFHHKTTIYISHRLTSAYLCNRIVSLEAGTIVEDSTHENLVNKNGIYSNLFKLQAEKYVV